MYQRFLVGLAFFICGSICFGGDSSPNTRSSEATKSSQQDRPPHGKTATFSIVAVDPMTGVCGAAVASKYPAVGRVVPYVSSGVGAFCTQHWHNPDWGPIALKLLSQGKSPQQVLQKLLEDDPKSGQRQLAIIDIRGRTAQHNPLEAGHSSDFWGAASGKFFACQGNTLVGREVIDAMAAAYEKTKGSLADRLMAALIAADCAGGDHRGRLAAGIRVCKKETSGYWLELHVDRSDDAVIELEKKYATLKHDAKGSWRGARLPFVHLCPDRKKPKPPGKTKPSK